MSIIKTQYEIKAVLMILLSFLTDCTLIQPFIFIDSTMSLSSSNVMRQERRARQLDRRFNEFVAGGPASASSSIGNPVLQGQVNQETNQNEEHIPIEVNFQAEAYDNFWDDDDYSITSDGSEFSFTSFSDDEAELNEEVAVQCLSLGEQIAGWAISLHVPHSHVNVLLKILKFYHPELPTDVRTLKKTPREVVIVQPIFPGSYYHFGIENGLRRSLACIPTNLLPRLKINLMVNVDGLRLTNSSNSQFWPILALIRGLNRFSEPFIVGTYHGYSKPADSSEFLYPFSNEFISLQEEGMVYNEKILKLDKCSFICDAPAKSFVTCTKGHSSQYHGCNKCTETGSIVGTLRTNTSFRGREHLGHHNGDSVLERIQSLNMVDDFPLDPMHLVDVGVVRRLLFCYIGSPKKRNIPNVTLKPAILRALNLFVLKVSKDMPKEFARRTSHFNDLGSMKATQLRSILHYFGIIVLKPFLSKEQYNHFLCLHIAIKLLSSEETCQHFNSYANNLLTSFVTQSSILFGQQFVSYNVHNLLHLAKDVLKFGKLSNFSAYPFENYMRYLKMFINKFENPLPQLVKRVIEKNHYFDRNSNEKVRQTADEKISFKLPHSLGPLPRGCLGNQFRLVKFGPWTLSNKDPDCCVYLQDGSIVLIRNFVRCFSAVEIIVGQKFLVVNEYFDDRFLSSTSEGLCTFYVSLSSLSELQAWKLSDIRCKGVKMSADFNETDNFVIMPLKMECS